jgi:DNA replicative helicase MCM subunit Mcm2 (Cdc46/Mcm family)
MKLQPFATEQDVDEALRLFQVSTLDAAMSGNLAGKHFANKITHGLARQHAGDYSTADMVKHQFVILNNRRPIEK